MGVPSLSLKLNWFLTLGKLPGLSFLMYQTGMMALPGFTSQDRLGSAARTGKPQILAVGHNQGVLLVYMT